jgi:hypothetical protein
MNRIKSTTMVYLPFGLVVMQREIRPNGDRTTFRNAFGKHNDIDFCDPLEWRGENRKFLRDLMILEGGASLEEANNYIRILISKQWSKRVGLHSMTINEGDSTHRGASFK